MTGSTTTTTTRSVSSSSSFLASRWLTVVAVVRSIDRSRERWDEIGVARVWNERERRGRKRNEIGGEEREIERWDRFEWIFWWRFFRFQREREMMCLLLLNVFGSILWLRLFVILWHCFWFCGFDCVNFLGWIVLLIRFNFVVEWIWFCCVVWLGLLSDFLFFIFFVL